MPCRLQPGQKWNGGIRWAEGIRTEAESHSKTSPVSGQRQRSDKQKATRGVGLSFDVSSEGVASQGWGFWQDSGGRARPLSLPSPRGGSLARVCVAAAINPLSSVVWRHLQLGCNSVSTASIPAAAQARTHGSKEAHLGPAPGRQPPSKTRPSGVDAGRRLG